MDQNKYVAQLMNQAGFMLAHSVEDVRLGRYSLEERTKLASGLEKLVQALRDENVPTVIDATRQRPGELRQRPGLIEWGTIP